jgi:hypothetical protein
MLGSRNCHLQQVVHRVLEYEDCLSLKSSQNTKSFHILESRNNKTSVNNTLINNSAGNNCFCTTDDRVIVVCDILTTPIVFKCKYFTNKTDIDHYPCKSSKLGIFRVNNLCPGYIYLHPKALKSKMCSFSS